MRMYSLSGLGCSGQVTAPCNRELMAQGLANIAAAGFGGIASEGSFSRSHDFERLQRSHPDISMKLLANISRTLTTRLRYANETIVELEL